MIEISSRLRFERKWNAQNPTIRQSIYQSKLFCRCRDDAPVKLRMLISSTKDGIAKKLDGIQHRLQANDDGDLDFFENAKVVSKGQAVF